MDWNSIYTSYPVNRELIWLNNAGSVPAGDHIIRALSRFTEDYARKGIFSEFGNYINIQRTIKSILGELLNCSPDELCLVHNTAEGMNIISHGLALSRDDEVILMENEFPSNVYPWWHLEKKGIKLLTAPMETSPESFMKSLLGLITKKTRVISLSAVHWCTGMPLPLERIGRICKQEDIVFVVDAAQGAGMQPLDVRRAEISFMAFSAWKWLMGPIGLGALYVAEERLDDIETVFMGTASVVKDKEFLPYKSELKPTADRFSVSTSSLVDWVYFEAALQFLRDIGFEPVQDRIYTLSSHLRRRLTAAGYRVFSESFSDHPTGIVVCEKQDVEPRVIMEHLKKNKIVAAERLGRVRLSPHIYNSIEQLDTVARVLEQI